MTALQLFITSTSRAFLYCFTGFFLTVFCWPASAQEPPTLRVLSYNIHHGEGMDRRLDLERLATVIKAANPDLVALQEVDRATQRSGGVDQASRLGELTGLHAVFGKAMDYEAGGYGLAILSRWPLLAARTHALPADPGAEPRVVLEAQAQLGEAGPRITLLVTHLDHVADPTRRMKQATKICELFPASSGGQPTIFAGDFNASPDSAVIQTLLEDWTDSAADRELLTWPADAPRTKIDYIFYRPASRWRPIETRALDEAIASDHRAVLAVFQIRPEHEEATKSNPQQSPFSAPHKPLLPSDD